MLGPCGFEAFVMRDIHRVDEDVAHIGLSSLLDVVPGLCNVGLLLLLRRHAGQRPPPRGNESRATFTVASGIDPRTAAGRST